MPGAKATAGNTALPNTDTPVVSPPSATTPFTRMRANAALVYTFRRLVVVVVLFSVVAVVVMLLLLVLLLLLLLPPLAVLRAVVEALAGARHDSTR